MSDHSLYVCLRETGTQRRWFIRVELIMRKILMGAPKFRAEAVGKSLGWTSLTMVSALALGFSALPLKVTNGHLTLNQAKAADTNIGDGRGGGGQGPSGGQGASSGQRDGGQGGSGQGASSHGGGPEGNIGNAVNPSETRGGPASTSESRGGSMGTSESRDGDKDRNAPITGRSDPGSNSGRKNDVVTGSGKGFQAGPAQGRGFNELTVPLFPAAPAPTKGKGTTTSIQQRIGDQSGPDIDSNAEAALIERGWK